MSTTLAAPVATPGQAYVIRAALLEDGWTFLEDPTDFRRRPAPREMNGWVRSIIYCPVLGALGGPTRLWRDGRHDVPAGAVHREIYTYSHADGVGVWLPA